MIDEDVTYTIKIGRLKWKTFIGALCDRRMPIKVKDGFYKIVIRPTMLYVVNVALLKCNVSTIRVLQRYKDTNTDMDVRPYKIR